MSGIDFIKRIFSIYFWLELFGIKDLNKKRHLRNKYHNFIIKFVLSLIIFIAMFIPSSLGYTFWVLVNPVGEIARAILAIGLLFIFGGTQLGLLLFGIYLIANIIMGD